MRNTLSEALQVSEKLLMLLFWSFYLLPNLSITKPEEYPKNVLFLTLQLLVISDIKYSTNGIFAKAPQSSVLALSLHKCFQQMYQARQGPLLCCWHKHVEENCLKNLAKKLKVDLKNHSNLLDTHKRSLNIQKPELIIFYSHYSKTDTEIIWEKINTIM